MIKYLEEKNNFNDYIKKEKVLVDFYADWCGPCQMMGQVLENIEFENIIKVNTDKFPELAQEYGVMSIPTLILFENGKIKKQTVGFQDATQINEFIK